MSKYEKLMETLERFHAGLSDTPGEHIQRLLLNWLKARAFYQESLEQKRVTKSMLATGMEQGLREMNSVVQAFPDEQRRQALSALHVAITECYPEFAQQDVARISKILQRGRIKGQSEYYLVRNRIDVLEGLAGSEAELMNLYALVEQFEK